MTINQFLEKHETLNGVILIQILTANPGRKFHILELANLLYNHKNPGRADNPAQHWLAGNSLPMVDAEAIRQYKKEIARLRLEQAKALSAQDTDKAASCERELNQIQSYYRDVTLPGGRIKNFALEPDLAYHCLLNAVKRVTAKARRDCPRTPRPHPRPRPHRPLLLPAARLVSPPDLTPPALGVQADNAPPHYVPADADPPKRSALRRAPVQGTPPRTLISLRVRGLSLPPEDSLRMLLTPTPPSKISHLSNSILEVHFEHGNT